VRIVDHVEAARAAKIKLTAIRAEAGYRTKAEGVFIKHGSRKRQPTSRKTKPIQATVKAKENETKQLAFDL
jgi:hypothetical protein